MTTTAILALVAAVPLMLGGCASVSASSVAREPAPAAEVTLAASSDTALLSAVVRALQGEPHLLTGLHMPIVVDPRPFLDGGGFPPVTSDVLDPLTPEILAARSRTLQQLGLQPGDAATPQMNCGGVMIPYPAPGEPDLKQGCPQNALIAVAVSLPRAGTAKLADGKPYDYASKSPAGDYWAVRVARSNVGPGGKSVLYYDVVLRKEGARWIYVTLIPLVILE